MPERGQQTMQRLLVVTSIITTSIVVPLSDAQARISPSELDALLFTPKGTYARVEAAALNPIGQGNWTPYVSAAFGIQSRMGRLEIEALHSWGFDDSGRTFTGNSSQMNLGMTAGFVNGIVQIPLGAFRPYAGFGVGMSLLRSDNYRIRDHAVWNSIGGSSNTSFAWNAQVGLDMAMDRVTWIGVGYRYLDFGSKRLPGESKHIRGHAVTVTIRREF